MRRLTRTTVVLGSVAALVATAGSDELPSLMDSTAAQEKLAVREVQELRGAARKLKRLSREVASAEDAGTAAYIKWLDSAVLRVGSLAGRWASSLKFFQRDFPPEALAADPERLAYAAKWLSDLNAQLGSEAAELKRNLEERNETFASRVSDSRVASARSIIASIGE